MKTHLKGNRWLAGLAACGFALATAAEPATPSRVTFDLLTGETTRRIVIELDESRAPRTCANFRKLVENGYYHELAVHRVIPNYLVQLGDPYTREPGKKHLWGTGGPDHTVPAELGGKHVRGAVAMARLPDSQNPGKESNGSQFYVALDDLKQLDGEYTVFGRVIRGIEHLDHISLLTADTNDVPISRVVIHRTGLGEETRAPSALAGAVKPVTVAAEGLKAVAANLPHLGGKDEPQPEKVSPQAAPQPPPPSAPPAAAAAALAPAPAAANPPPALPTAIAADLPAPAAENPLPLEETDRPRFPMLSKLAPSKLLVLGRKKEDDAASGAASPEPAPAAPAAEAGEPGGKWPRLPLFHKKPAEATETKPSAPVAATPNPKPGAEPEAAGQGEKNQDGAERKGFLGRMLDKVRPGGGE